MEREKMQKKRTKKTDGMDEEKTLFFIGWGLMAGVLIYFIWIKSGEKTVMPCLFHIISGGYCPGCGGTRAVKYFVQGKIVKSFYYHPLVPYTAVVGGAFMITQTITRISRGKWNIGMKYHAWYAWLAVAILVLNCLIKNAAIFLFGIDMLK